MKVTWGTSCDYQTCVITPIVIQGAVSSFTQSAYPTNPLTHLEGELINVKELFIFKIEK